MDDVGLGHEPESLPQLLVLGVEVAPVVEHPAFVGGLEARSAR